MNNLPDPISFEAALEKFLAHLKDHQRSTATSVAYHGDLRQLHTYLTQKRITQATSVQTVHLEEFVAHLSTTGYTPKSISRASNFLCFFGRLKRSPDSSRIFLRSRNRNNYLTA